VRLAKLAAPLLFSRRVEPTRRLSIKERGLRSPSRGPWRSTGGTGSAGEAGRRAPQGGALGGAVVHVTIVLYPPSVRVSDKAGAENTGMPQGKK
jgi:hypothetical protein